MKSSRCQFCFWLVKLQGSVRRRGCKLGWFGVYLLCGGSHLNIVTALCQLEAGTVFVGFQSVLPLL